MEKRKLPYQYKAPFSPVDVIEEYTRPARFIRNSKLVIKPALSDIELIEFEKAGVKFGLEVHPTEIAFDIASSENVRRLHFARHTNKDVSYKFQSKARTRLHRFSMGLTFRPLFASSSERHRCFPPRPDSKPL